VEFKVGTKASYTFQISQEAHNAFQKLTGDTPNPAHFNSEAVKGHYDKPIVSGMQTIAFAGCALRRLFVTPTTMPILMATDVEYRKPIYVGDSAEAVVKIIDTPKKDTYSVSVDVGTGGVTAMNGVFTIRIMHY